MGARHDACRDYCKMRVHGFGAGVGHDDGGASCASRADGAEDVGPLIAGVLGFARGAEPLRAQMRVSVPFWPTRASSWNPISSGLPMASAGSAAFTVAAKFF